METKYHDTAGQLDMVRADLEEALRKNQALEKKLQASLLNQVCGNALPTVEPLTHHFAKGHYFSWLLSTVTSCSLTYHTNIPHSDTCWQTQWKSRRKRQTAVFRGTWRCQRQSETQLCVSKFGLAQPYKWKESKSPRSLLVLSDVPHIWSHNGSETSKGMQTFMSNLLKTISLYLPRDQ